jgi:hypothetical protein
VRPSSNPSTAKKEKERERERGKKSNRRKLGKFYICEKQATHF